jgi:hypothetical protein
MFPPAAALHPVYISTSCCSLSLSCLNELLLSASLISPPANALYPSPPLPTSALYSMIMSLPVTSLPQKSPPPPPAAAIFTCRMSTKVASLLYPSTPLVHISANCYSLLWRMSMKVASLLYPSPSPLSFISLAAAALYPVQVSKVGLHSHTHTQIHGRSGLGAAFLAYQPGARRFPHARGPPSTREGGGE